MIKKTNFRKKESGLVMNTAVPIFDISGKGLSMIKFSRCPLFFILKIEIGIAIGIEIDPQTSSCAMGACELARVHP